MSEAQDRFSGTKPIDDRLAFDVGALGEFMRQNVDGFAGELEVRQFRGGQSNPTYALVAGGREYVMRRKPPGKLLPSAHAVDREYRVITALGQTDVPVPRTYALCTDEAVIGTWFFIMERVHGRIFWDLGLPNSDPAERAAIFDATNDVIARLHKVDSVQVGLGDFGRPGNYFARQLNRWTKQYQASETDRIPEMDRLAEWLPANIPGGDETCVVHGDYRLDNMVVHPTEPRVLAVLDWELSTLGHPLGDFAYHCMSWRIPSGLFRGLGGLDLAELGIPGETDYVAAYCRRTGRAGIENWPFYLGYNMFRLAAIAQGIVGRVRDGTAASEYATEMAARVRPLARMGWAEVEKILGAN